MTWGEEFKGRSEDFQAKALDPAKVLDSESTAVLGIGATSPTVDAQRESAGSMSAQASTGDGAWRRRLAPHHRDAVKHFFSGPKHD